MPPGVARLPSARAGQVSARVVRAVAVDPPLHPPSPQFQHAPPDRGFQSLEVEVRLSVTHQRLDFHPDAELNCLESVSRLSLLPFARSPCAKRARDNWSLTSTNSPVSARKRLCSAIWRRTDSSREGAIEQATDLPPILRVRYQ